MKRRKYNIDKNVRGFNYNNRGFTIFKVSTAEFDL